MNIISIIKEIASVLDEAANPVRTNASIRPVPIEAIKKLLKENRTEHAIGLLQKTMQWNYLHAKKFVDDLQQAEISALSAPRSHVHSTQIDKLVREHAALEAGAGGSLWNYLFGRFSKQ